MITKTGKKYYECKMRMYGFEGNLICEYESYKFTSSDPIKYLDTMTKRKATNRIKVEWWGLKER